MKFQALMAKWRVRLGHIFSIALVIFSKPDTAFLAAGLCVSMIGEALRIYSAGHIKKNEALSSDGPYGLCRNPLYLGSFLVMTGFCLASLQPVATAIFFLSFWIVYGATIQSEERFLGSEFGEAYGQFCASTPRFFPTPGSLMRLTKGNFSMAQAWKNKEHEGLIGVLLVHAAMAAKMIWLNAH